MFSSGAHFLKGRNNAHLVCSPANGVNIFSFDLSLIWFYQSDGRLVDSLCHVEGVLTLVILCATQNLNDVRFVFRVVEFQVSVYKFSLFNFSWTVTCEFVNATAHFSKLLFIQRGRDIPLQNFAI